MKTTSNSTRARTALGTIFILCGLFLGALGLTNAATRSHARRAQLSSIDTPSTPQTFSGTYDASSPFPCSTPRHHFTVPPGQVRIIVNVAATLQTNDLEMTLLFGSDPNPVPIHT